MAGAGRGASLTFVGLFGDLEVRVPPDSRVMEGGGLSIAGDKDIDVSTGDGPEISIKVYGLFSDAMVTDRPRA